MKKIEGELSTPFQRNVGYRGGEYLTEVIYKKEWNKFGATVNNVRASEGYPVKTFRQLIDEVALVTINNKSYEMFYRGQSTDYLNNQGVIYSDRIKKSMVLPSICRPELKADGTPKYSIRKKTVEERYEKLYKLIEYINQTKRLRLREEYLMAIFQHYEVLPTPLIDITQSLRVAATFALMKYQKGYLYVFGLPFPNQSISYFIDLEIILLKLQNLMPVEALRPRYQEGYLVGKFPFDTSKSISDDLSNRMVAKFCIDNTKDDFWDEHFLPMPKDVLYPQDDKIEKIFKNFKEEFEKNIRE